MLNNVKLKRTLKETIFKVNRSQELMAEKAESEKVEGI